MKSGFMGKTIFLLFLSFSFILAQSYSTLFSEYIPQTLKKNPESLEKLDENFSYYGKINPALIYPFIIYLNRTESNERIKALKYLNTLTNESIQKTNRWLDSEVKYTNTNGISLENWLKLQLFLYKKKKTSKVDKSTFKAPYSIDKNLKNYLSYLYLTRELQDFDQSVDYKNQISILLNNTISLLKDADENYKKMSALKREELIELAKTYFYLFADAPNSLSNKNMDITFSSFIIKLMRPENTEQNLLSLSNSFNRGLGQKNKNTYFDKEGIVNIKRIDRFNTSFSNLFYVGFGARFKIKKYKSYLSHISIYGSYSVSSQENFNITNQETRKSYVDTINYQYKTITANYTTPLIQDFSAQAFSLTLSTPVYIWNNIYFDFGFLYRFITYKYQYSYSRNDEFSYIDGNQEHLVNYKKNSEFTDYINRINFVAGFNIDLFKYVTLRVNSYGKDINYDLYLHCPL